MAGVEGDEGVPEEGGGRMGKAAEEEEGVVEVDGKKGGKKFSGSEGIGDLAGYEEMGVNLLEFAGGEVKAVET